MHDFAHLTRASVCVGLLAEQRNDPDFVEGSGSRLSELKKKALAKKEQASAKLQAAKARRETQSQETEQDAEQEAPSPTKVRID